MRNLLQQRYGNRSGLRLLEISPSTSTSVPLALEKQVSASAELELAVSEVARVLKPKGEFVLQPWNFFQSEPGKTATLMRYFKVTDWRPYQVSNQPFSGDFLLVLKKH